MYYSVQQNHCVMVRRRTIQRRDAHLIIAVRLLFAVNSLTWAVFAALVWSGTVGVGVDDPAKTMLALLMVGNAVLLALAGWRTLRGQRIVDLAGVALVAVNTLLTVTDEVGGYDLAILILNLALLVALLAGIWRTARESRAQAAVSRMRRAAAESGAVKLSPAEIDAEIADVRRERSAGGDAEQGHILMPLDTNILLDKECVTPISLGNTGTIAFIRPLSGRSTMQQPSIIVTGASQGLGAAIASAAADLGAQVTLTARSAERLVINAQRITERGGKALAVAGDISRLEDCRRIIDETLAAFGRIDALVNNAGTIEPLGLVAETDPEEWARHIAINLLGPVMMCRLAAPYLREVRGRVVNVTSHGAQLVIPGASAYSASKAALNQVSKTFAAEEPAIAVILFIPGEVDTAMQAVIREKGKGKTTDDIYRFFAELHEQGRLLPATAPALAAASLALRAPLELSGEILTWDDERVQQLIPR